MTDNRDDRGAVPRRVGHYEIHLPIASGGMGSVYLGRARGLAGFEREVAIKVMHAHLREERQFTDDLIEEAKLAGRLKHRHVVPVLDVGEDAFGVFLVMEYIEGDSLSGLWRARNEDQGEEIDPRVGLRILADTLAGLHAAHELRDDSGNPLSLVHRDVSPQNILVGLDGTSRLTDFGVAKASSRLSHTATGLIKGKVRYMSPEQAKSEPLDRRSDLWSAGVIAWELLAGRRLYRVNNEATVLLQLVSELPPRLRRIDPAIPTELDEAVARALSLDVNARFDTARQFADALRDGAEAIGGLASYEQVADYLQATAGPMLERRRQQLREIIKLQREMDSIEEVAAAESRRAGSASPVLAIATPTGKLLDEATDGDTTTLSVSDAETVPDGPVDPPEVTGMPHAVDVAQRERRSSGNRRAYLRAVAAITLVIAVALGYRTMSEDPHVANSSIASALATTVLSASEPTQASTAGNTTATTARSNAPTAPAANSIDIEADTKVREIWVADRRILIAPPSKNFAVRLLAGESQAKLRAISIDGRSTQAAVTPGAAQLTLSFRPKRAVPAAPKVTPPTTQRAAPLAASPYDR